MSNVQNQLLSRKFSFHPNDPHGEVQNGSRIQKRTSWDPGRTSVGPIVLSPHSNLYASLSRADKRSTLLLDHSKMLVHEMGQMGPLQ